MKVMDDRKAELDSQYVYYSPIGSTIKRKQREIDFTTQSYLSILQSLNAARLRQKNLQMNSATLKVITPPTFPLESMPSKRKMMVVGGFVGTIIFILGVFFLLELLDRTLRDKSRAERLTGGKVLGAVPRKGFRRRSYHKEHLGASMQYLGNALLDYCKPGQQSVINILSLRSGSGKSFVAEHLAEYFRRRDIKIGEDVILAEYKALYDASVPALRPARTKGGRCTVVHLPDAGRPERGRDFHRSVASLYVLPEAGIPLLPVGAYLGRLILGKQDV